MAPWASKTLGLSCPRLAFAGVCVAPDMPPEPCGLTLYFSDILTVEVVKKSLVGYVQRAAEKLVVRIAGITILISGFDVGKRPIKYGQRIRP